MELGANYVCTKGLSKLAIANGFDPACPQRVDAVLMNCAITTFTGPGFDDTGHG